MVTQKGNQKTAFTDQLVHSIIKTELAPSSSEVLMNSKML